jgi:hypothetical protein
MNENGLEERGNCRALAITVIKTSSSIKLRESDWPLASRKQVLLHGVSYLGIPEPTYVYRNLCGSISPPPHSGAEGSEKG